MLQWDIPLSMDNPHPAWLAFALCGQIPRFGQASSHTHYQQPHGADLPPCDSYCLTMRFIVPVLRLRKNRRAQCPTTLGLSPFETGSHLAGLVLACKTTFYPCLTLIVRCDLVSTCAGNGSILYQWTPTKPRMRMGEEACGETEGRPLCIYNAPPKTFQISPGSSPQSTP
jgi:hypothetical protein